MERVLQGLTWKFFLVYLDDIVIIGNSFEEHHKHLEEVLKRLRASNLKLSGKYCKFFEKEVQCLGHIASTCPEKVKAVLE